MAAQNINKFRQKKQHRKILTRTDVKPLDLGHVGRKLEFFFFFFFSLVNIKCVGLSL
jgi:hypothetical protein